jgi:hypothetical protein
MIKLTNFNDKEFNEFSYFEPLRPFSLFLNPFLPQLYVRSVHLKLNTIHTDIQIWNTQAYIHIGL